MHRKKKIRKFRCLVGKLKPGLTNNRSRML